MNLSQFFSFPPTLPDKLKSNFIYLYWDIAWWGLYTGTTASFLTIYAARCGATPGQIGLLTAAPAILSMVLSLPAGRLIKRVPATRATVLSCFFTRIFYIFYALLPWLLPANRQVEAILVLAVITAIPGTGVGISFYQFFMEAVPSDWRGTVVGNRNAILSIITFIVTMISGQILTRMAFPSGYQVVFLIGFIGAIMTIYQLAHVRSVVAPPPAIEVSTVAEVPITSTLSPHSGQSRRGLPAVGIQERRYLKVIGLLFLFNLSNNMVGPLIPNLLVHTLKLSDATISIGTAASSMLVLVVSLFIARLTMRTGNHKATALGAVLLSFQTVSLALAHDATLYLVSTVVAGVASGILNVAQYNYHLDNVPLAERSTWLSWNLLLGNAAVLLGALGGPMAARVTGTPAALIILGALRLLMGLVILKFG